MTHLFYRTEIQLHKRLRPIRNNLRKILPYFPFLRKFVRIFKREISAGAALGAATILPGKGITKTVRFTFAFEIPEVLANKPIFETRIWSSGAVGFCLKSIVIRPI